MSKTTTFSGLNVYLSRNLVPPEIFDSLHDALRHGGASVFLCSDPSRNGPDDFHVISSDRHEKFDDLQKKGCRMLGPQCVLSCAKEHRPLPKQGFTCCLAMDGDKVLTSGFEADEKLEIGKMVTAMGGVIHTKASSDVSFVIVKSVLAAKYKWALNVQKPTVTLSWLHQCWKEHHLVPHESYRVPPFSGLTICVSKVPAAERKEMEKAALQNGGKYSAELTRKCTHLICDAPEGDKYKVAKRWGNILIVTRKWFDQSVARRACLNEESYPVQGVSMSKTNSTRTCLPSQCSQDKGMGSSEFVPSSAGDSHLDTLLHANHDIEVTLSENTSTMCKETPTCAKEEFKSENNLDNCVADDSQSEDDNLYLADCRIHLRGFDALEMRKLVNMVRRGGGSRYMAMNEKLTHIIIGNLSETEKKEVRGLAAMGVIYIVRPAWLEDCDREKKEVLVHKGHIATDLLLTKDSMCQGKGATVDMPSMKQKNTGIEVNSIAGTSLKNNAGCEVNSTVTSSIRTAMVSDTQSQSSAPKGKGKGKDKGKDGQKMQQDMKSIVFEGRVFCFGSSFPPHRRGEVIEWINMGRGRVVADKTQQKVHFIVEDHGRINGPCGKSGVITVSSHWVRSCLADGCLVDVASHILYSPLPCQIPLPGFEEYRICISQYDEKDRHLLRNLCTVLGAPKFTEKFTRKVTHLLCKFTNGPKYEAASKLGIQCVTCDWIYECVKQNEIVSLGPFSPKAVTSQDHEMGLCTLTQYPTQAAKMIVSQFPNNSNGLRKIHTRAITSDNSGGEHDNLKTDRSKRARTFEDDSETNSLSTPNLGVKQAIETTLKVSDVVPDVAAAIEDLLEQTSKIHDLNSRGSDICDKNLFSYDCSMPEQIYTGSRVAVGLTERWINRSDGKVDTCIPSENANLVTYDGFSETQTESQVVGYEEDLSGRQMIIDRVRTRSTMI